jgi:hypothetical protein
VEPILKEGHPDLEEVRFACGVWHRKEGKIGRSVRELTALRDSITGEGVAAERRAIKARAELATSQGWSGQLKVACRELSSIVAHAEQALRHNDPLTLHVRYTSAVWTGRADRHREARDLLTELLECQRQVLGDDHISTLKTRLELAVWTGHSDERDALLQLLDQGEDWIRVCGPDHPYALRMRHILAQYRGKIGDLNKAHTEMRAVYGRRRQVLGDRHPDTQDRLRIQGMRSIETFRTRRLLAEWIARAGHPETGLAELRYLRADLGKFVEDGHPELKEVAAAIAELS